MSKELPEWVGRFNAELLDFYDHVSSLKDQEVDQQLACNLLVSISQMKSGLAEVYSEMEKIVITLVSDRDPVRAYDGSVIEKMYDKSRKAWQHKTIANVVADRIQRMAVDLDTGEVMMSTHDMITKLLDFAGVSYWKVTSLKDIGIDADDYCEAGESTPKITVRKAK